MDPDGTVMSTGKTTSTRMYHGKPRKRRIKWKYEKKKNENNEKKTFNEKIESKKEKTHTNEDIF